MSNTKDPKRKPFARFSSLFGRSHWVRSSTASALTTTGSGVASVGASGKIANRGSAAAWGASGGSGSSLTAEESRLIQDIDALSTASVITGNTSITAAATVRVIDKIKNALDLVENDDSGAFETISIDHLSHAAGRYTNSTWPTNLMWLSPFHVEPSEPNFSGRVPDPEGLQNTSTWRELASFIKLAAHAAYQIRTRPDIAQDVRLEASETDVHTSAPNRLGETREIRLPRTRTGLWKPTDVKFVMDKVDEGEGGTVIIAIRGSRTWMDWMVNFDCGLVDASPLTGVSGMKAHAGLFAVAVLMKKRTIDALKQQIGYPDNMRSDGKKPRLIFTGHSAGGAVAALLWQSFIVNKYVGRQNGEENLSTAFDSVHCVTFGAPPVTSPALAGPKKLHPTDPDDILISIVNEGDPVPRADFPYIKALLYVYSNTDVERDYDYGGIDGCLCQLPPMTLQNAGGVIGLRVIEPEAEGGTEQVRGVELEPEIIEKTLAVNPLAHSMALYAANINAFVDQDIPSLRAKEYTTKKITFVALPTASPKQRLAGPQFGGFMEWYAAGDLDAAERWFVSGMVDGEWRHVVSGFRVPKYPQRPDGSPGGITGTETYEKMKKMLDDERRDRDTV